MLKIGIDCEPLETDIWGISRILSKLLETCASDDALRNRCKFILYFKSHVPDLEFLKSPIFEVRLLRIPFLKRQFFSLYYYVRLPLRILIDRPDVTYLANYMLPIFFPSKSIVMFTEDVYHEMRSPHQRWRYRIAYKLFANWAARNATRLHALSNSSKDEIIRLFNVSADRINVIYPGVDISGAEKHSSNSKTGNNILFVGQAFPRRHLKETLESFLLLARRNPSLNMHIIGYDRYNPPIISKMIEMINRELGRNAVSQVDRVSPADLIDAYSKADIVTYISSAEAFGLPPIEALHFGAVPVVADTKINHELLENSCYYVRDPKNKTEITETIDNALNDNQGRLTKIKNASGIIERYTWRSFTSKFIDLCYQIASS